MFECVDNHAFCRSDDLHLHGVHCLHCDGCGPRVRWYAISTLVHFLFHSYVAYVSGAFASCCGEEVWCNLAHWDTAGGTFWSGERVLKGSRGNALTPSLPHGNSHTHTHTHTHTHLLTYTHTHTHIQACHHPASQRAVCPHTVMLVPAPVALPPHPNCFTFTFSTLLEQCVWMERLVHSTWELRQSQRPSG